jgi:TolB protein
MRPWKVLVFLVGLLLALEIVGGALIFHSSGADVYLGISKPGAKKLSMAVVGFSAKLDGPKGENLTERAFKTLRSDMDFSALIEVVDPSSLPFNPNQIKLGQEKDVLPRLPSLSIQVMLAADLARSENKLLLEAKLYDVSTRQQVFHNRYVSDSRGVSAAVHRLSDDIIYYLTGERGVARTKLGLVSDKTGAKEIYVMDFDGTNLMMMTRNQSLNLTPRWSPDGKFLAYVSYRDGNPDLYLLDVTCGRRTKISSLPGLNISPAWAPDGKSIALALSKNGITNIYIMRSDGSGLRQLTKSNAISVSPSWSPNGRQIAFVSDQGGTPQVYVMDAEGTNIRRLTFKGNYNTSPAWSPRGDKIAFVSNQNGSLEIFTINPDGSGVLGLTRGAGSNESPSWSPDGRHIAFSSTRQGKSAIFIMRQDGSGQRRVTPDDAAYYTPDWSSR